MAAREIAKKDRVKQTEFLVGILLFLLGVSLTFALFSFAQAAGFLPTPEPETFAGNGFQEFPIGSSQTLGASAKAMFFDLPRFDFSTLINRLRELAVL